MIDSHETLLALQHGDSLFPTGAMSFSWGLESLVAARVLSDADQVGRFVEGQIRYRWATLDRPVLAACHSLGADLGSIGEIDALVEAMSLCRELREGSARAGRALLNIHGKLATPHAQSYRELITDGTVHGHLPVVQGLLARSLGFSLSTAAAVSVYTLSVGLLSAALRLGVLGHVDCQRLLNQLRPVTESLLREAPLPLEKIRTYAAQTEIAAMHHETQSVRLFVN